ncbi:Auxin-binding protein [Burkholderia sp. MS389]|nr:Auxin-binding protein [Burkholderia cenocepacia]OXI68629.1 Auxin-binding protein [Burkholderia sp. AU31280]QRR17768.1 Auxin-binding protein [Burkholderia sp. MS389]QVN15773.1 FixH family protein [Burkholderia sp. LAS2]RQU64933.1 Auxin-binding protein [Burkholderia cenocepacia]
MRSAMRDRTIGSAIDEMSMKSIRRRIVMLAFAGSGIAMLGACGAPAEQPAPAGLNLSLTQATASGAYVVTLEPPTTPPPLNRIHAWTVIVKRASGEPVRGARIDVGGGMPQHGHGLPTRPRVIDGDANGTYRLQGMKFSMPGWWTITLKVRDAQRDDDVTFNVVLPPAAAS